MPALAVGSVPVFSLLVVACTIGLTTSESRDEHALLRALGMPPRVGRSVVAWQATLLPLLGTVVAVPLGLACAVAVAWWRPVPAESAVSVPWLAVAGLLVGVPAASGLATRLVGAATGGRSRSLDLIGRLAWE